MRLKDEEDIDRSADSGVGDDECRSGARRRGIVDHGGTTAEDRRSERDGKGRDRNV